MAWMKYMEIMIFNGALSCIRWNFDFFNFPFLTFMPIVVFTNYLFLIF